MTDVIVPFECVADMGAQEFVCVCGGYGLSGDVEGCFGGGVFSEVGDEFFGFGGVEL